MLKTVLYRLAFLALFYAAVSLAFDPLLRWALVRGLESSVGAKAEIADVDSGLFPPRLEVSGLSVADPEQPMRNLLEFDRAVFHLEGEPLLRKRFIIREASLEGLKPFGPRKTSGALPKRKLAPSVFGPVLAARLDQTKDLALDRTGELKGGVQERLELKEDDLRSLRLAEDLKTRYEGKWKDWESRFGGQGLDGKAQALKKDLDAALQEKDDLKKAARLAEVLKQAGALAEQVDGLSKELDGTFSGLQGDLAAIEQAKKDDLAQLQSRLKLPSLDADSISRFLMGPAAAAKMDSALGWVKWTREKMPPSQPKPAPPERGRGLTVSFGLDRDWPLWALREGRVTGSWPMAEGETLALEGTLRGLSAEPRLWPDPAELRLSGKALGASKMSARLSATMDRRREPSKDLFELAFDGAPIGPMSLGSQESLQVRLSAGRAAVDGRLEIEDDGLDGALRFSERGLQADASAGPKAGGEKVSRLVASAVSGLERIQVEAKVGGTLGDPSFSFSTDLGRVLAEGLKNAVGAEVAAQKKELQARLDALVDAKRAALEGDLEKEKARLLAKAGLPGGELKDLRKAAEKELEKAGRSVVDPKKLKKDLKKLFR